MKKDKVTMFAEESYNDLDDNIGIVMPILTDCDVDEDFTEGMEKVGEELPILPLRNIPLSPAILFHTINVPKLLFLTQFRLLLHKTIVNYYVKSFFPIQTIYHTS